MECPGRAAQQRAERKDAIIQLFAATEQIERFRIRSASDADSMAVLEELLSAVWLAKKVIELVCSGEVAQAAQDYVREVDACCRLFMADSSVATSARERQLRTLFLEAARQEMGYEGPALRNRVPMHDASPPVSEGIGT
jgi:hypothetical protein